MKLKVGRKEGGKLLALGAVLGAAAYLSSTGKPVPEPGPGPIPSPLPVPEPGPGPIPPQPMTPRFAVGDEIRSYTAGWWKYRITSINWWNYAYWGDRTDYFGGVALVNYAWAELEKPDYYKVN